MDRELDAIFLENVAPVGLCFAALYVVFTALHPFSLSPDVAQVMVPLAGATAIMSALTSIMVRADMVPLKFAYPVGGVLVLMGVLNSSVHMWLTEDLDQSTNFALGFIVVGLFFLSWRFLAVAYFVIFVTWAAVAGTFPDVEREFEHFFIMNVIAMVLGVLAQWLRVSVYRRLLFMRHEANLREQRLAEAFAKEKLYASAQKANRSKTEFLANMSHELRTPLNAIIGFSETMMHEIFGPVGNDRYKEYIKDINGAGTHLLSMVNDILDLSRVELENVKIEPQPVDPETICKNCLLILRSRADKGSVELNFDVSEPVAQIASDERRIKQILFNLLGNAVKFTPPGGTVTLALAPSEDGGIRISVRDTGIGMNEEQLKHALEPFWQADTGLDRAFEGTGLGLALTDELVRVLQGHFEIESRPGVGTTATVTLPKAIQPEAEEKAARAAD